MIKAGLLLVVALGTLTLTSRAFAHGDATAHTLETDNLVTSYARPPTTAVELQLRGLLDTAARRGYPIKVSLIANEGDTGGDTVQLTATQAYAMTITDELGRTEPLLAPVLIVTPGSLGLGGRQPRNGELARITPVLARTLLHGIAPPRSEDGTSIARTAMTAVRQLARAAGHTLPRHVPPATQNLDGILGGARRDESADASLFVVILGSIALLAGLVALLDRRAHRRT